MKRVGLLPRFNSFKKILPTSFIQPGVKISRFFLYVQTKHPTLCESLVLDQTFLHFLKPSEFKTIIKLDKGTNRNRFRNSAQALFGQSDHLYITFP